jgi:thiazole synthase ThiGH ThiG subunit
MVQVEGYPLNQNVIFLRPNPSTSSVYEELIHTAQLRRGMDRETQWLEMEIEAAQKLIRFADAYKIPASETQQTMYRLNLLLKMRE